MCLHLNECGLIAKFQQHKLDQLDTDLGAALPILKEQHQIRWYGAHVCNKPGDSNLSYFCCQEHRFATSQMRAILITVVVRKLVNLHCPLGQFKLCKQQFSGKHKVVVSAGCATVLIGDGDLKLRRPVCKNFNARGWTNCPGVKNGKLKLGCTRTPARDCGNYCVPCYTEYRDACGRHGANCKGLCSISVCRKIEHMREIAACTYLLLAFTVLQLYCLLTAMAVKASYLLKSSFTDLSIFCVGIVGAAAFDKLLNCRSINGRTYYDVRFKGRKSVDAIAPYDTLPAEILLEYHADKVSAKRG